MKSSSCLRTSRRASFRVLGAPRPWRRCPAARRPPSRPFSAHSMEARPQRSQLIGEAVPLVLPRHFVCVALSPFLAILDQLQWRNLHNSPVCKHLRVFVDCLPSRGLLQSRSIPQLCKEIFSSWWLRRWNLRRLGRCPLALGTHFSKNKPARNERRDNNKQK